MEWYSFRKKKPRVGEMILVCISTGKEKMLFIGVTLKNSNTLFNPFSLLIRFTSLILFYFQVTFLVNKVIMQLFFWTCITFTGQDYIKKELTKMEWYSFEDR